MPRAINSGITKRRRYVSGIMNFRGFPHIVDVAFICRGIIAYEN